MRRHTLLKALLVLALLPTGARSQDANVLLPVDTVERRLALDVFEVMDFRPSRGLTGERTRRAALSYPDGTMLLAKWAPAPVGGEAFNNTPRFELGAYAVQKLFLEEGEYVVPPTVILALPLEEHRALMPRVPATLHDTDAVLVVLQYWLYNVTPDDFWSADRFQADTVYARHFSNFNIMTYLIRHGDENTGNYLISSDPVNPRVFAVDNGVSFSSPDSDRGYRWRRLRVQRVPAATIERLRALTLETLTARLETLAEFRILPDGRLERSAPGPAIDPERGIRRTEDRIQLGLTRREIREVWGRMEHLLARVDRGDLEVF